MVLEPQRRQRREHLGLATRLLCPRRHAVCLPLPAWLLRRGRLPDSHTRASRLISVSSVKYGEEAAALRVEVGDRRGMEPTEIPPPRPQGTADMHLPDLCIYTLRKPSLLRGCSSHLWMPRCRQRPRFAAWWHRWSALAASAGRGRTSVTINPDSWRQRWFDSCFMPPLWTETGIAAGSSISRNSSPAAACPRRTALLAVVAAAAQMSPI
ncbi:hypothetical protein N658DRAFT_331373 [Parathielavia hyrcaniae]|uniref:Uncharacterized protein n=1 Tax=Parathielavia hyrcaniae TaxID=113614 RepID=A0AAN6Q518_9PEZI|nr:hypothetical protein N658DRAFT_331373 [Parathielavia hyrcaniae]